MGKVILIAGALGDVGVGVAEHFRSKGATVLIAPGKLCSPDEIEVRYGPVDLVVFCSGTAAPRTEDVPALVTAGKPAPLLKRWRAKLAAMI